MKIRNGFVSNSSSSSFIIATREECTLPDILYGLGVIKGSYIDTILLQPLTKAYEDSALKMTLKSLADECDYNTVEGMLADKAPHPAIKYLQDGWNVRVLEVSSESGGRAPLLLLA